jgi:hypothetical protein
MFTVLVLISPFSVFPVYGKYGEFRVVCGTLNRLRIRGTNLNVYEEDAERHKPVNMSVNSERGETPKAMGIYS